MVAAAVGAYLLLAVGLWVHVWTGNPAATASCGCGDSALTMWFLEWPAHALAHGLNPLYSDALFHPVGVNLLSNTGVLAIGVSLAPVTWLAGPVATLAVASTVVPAASATAAYFLVARWTRWAPAAFVAGLLYGFSPFVVDNVAGGHLNVASLFVLPLIAGRLDQLLVRQSGRPVRTGLALGLLVVVQFFLSTEILLIAAVGAGLAVAVLAAVGVAGDPADVVRRVRWALPGLAVAAAVAVGVLAYPTWYGLAGPAHLSGQVWPSIATFDHYGPGDLLVPHPGTWWQNTLSLWGYFGPAPPAEVYLGAGAVAVAVAGLVAFRRDGRLWLFGAVGLGTAALSLGTAGRPWAPWRLFQSLPLLDDVIQGRFVVVTLLCVAVMVGITVDRAWAATHRGAAGGRRRPGRAVAAAVVPVGLVAVALVPSAVAMAPAVPLTTQAVQAPRWLAQADRYTSPDDVLLVYPPPFSGVQSAMAWQATAGLPYLQAGGGGPQGLPSRAGAARAGMEVLDALSSGFSPSEPTGTAAELRSVRAALRTWGVGTVVVPRQVGPPLIGQGRDAAYAAGFFTAVLGRTPRIQADAWVWTDVARSPPPLAVGPTTLLRCWGAGRRAPVPSPVVPACVAAAGR
ncbi:MAG TPA: hypothetical protein VHB02_04185 [Acidimicrobiales bacterium]|nr:hypothetical protein [Acidimicrobiales bacterium]